MFVDCGDNGFFDFLWGLNGWILMFCVLFWNWCIEFVICNIYFNEVYGVLDGWVFYFWFGRWNGEDWVYEC